MAAMSIALRRLVPLCVAAVGLGFAVAPAHAAVCMPNQPSTKQPFTDVNGYLQVHVCLDDASGGGGGVVTQGTTPWVDNISQFGGVTVSLGQQVAASSIPVVLPSNGTLPLPTGAASNVAQGTTITGTGGTVVQDEVFSTLPALAGSTVHSPAIGVDGATWTELFPTSIAMMGIAPTVSTSQASAGVVLKASAGNLYDVYVSAAAATSFLVVINGTTIPASAATIVPIECIPVDAQGDASRTYDVIPEAFSTGIVALISTGTTAACTTYTPGAGFIHGRVK